jgi:RNA polymerase sigma factor (sigma-70 family)
MTREPLTQFVRQLRRTLDADALGAASDSDLLLSFRRDRDPAAFEAIVRRHGPRVLTAARKVLGDPADVDDAFQATFLILMRDPGACRDGKSLGGWLYGVAHRVSLKAMTRRRRREEVESRAGSQREQTPDLSWREACAILHEELDRLPDSYRLPLMLCYLDGRSRDEAATHLGRTLHSVKKSLEKGREELRKRLRRRGVALSAGLLAAVAAPAGSAGVPSSTVQSAVSAVVGHTVSPAAATLAHALRGHRIPWRAAIGSAIAASVVTVCVALGQAPKPAVEPPRLPAADEAPVAKAGDPLPERFTYRGRVLGPDGKPVKDAQIFLLALSPASKPISPRAKTDADGRFAFEVARSEFDYRSFEYSHMPWRYGHLIASAPGFGIAWTQAMAPDSDTEMTLAADDAPIEGCILNLQGQPVAGATVRVLWVLRTQSGELAKWHDGLKGIGDREGWRALQGLQGLMHFSMRRYGLEPAVPHATTGKDGRFTLKGLGRDRIALVRIEGDGMATQQVFVVPRPGEAKSVDSIALEARMMSAQTKGIPQDTFLGNKFDLIVAPSRPVTGVVTEVDTGKPVAGAFVCSWQYVSGLIDRHRTWTVTDAEGRYTLRGLPAEKDLQIRVDPPDDQPYLAITAHVPDQAGLEPVKLDLKVKRGIWLTGNVLDRETKNPVQAIVRYSAELDNPHLKGIPDFTIESELRSRQDDGGFRVAIVPGKGYLSVLTGSPDHPRYGIAGDVPAGLPEQIATKPFTIWTKSLNALIPLNVPDDAKEARQEVLLTPGKGVTVTIVGPEGEKLKGIVATTDTYGSRPQRLGDDGKLTVRGVSTGKAKYVQAVCPEKKLAGKLKVTSEDKTPTLKLEPWLGMRGRVVDEDGNPVPNAELSFVGVRASPADDDGHGFWYKDPTMRADAAGRYEMDGLVPGMLYSIAVKYKGQPGTILHFRADWKAGELKDMGDLKPRP